MNQASGGRQLTCSVEQDCSLLFCCRLDDQPAQLLPKPALAALRRMKPASALYLNPGCFISDAEPLGLPFTARFSASGKILWILDSNANALTPFWLGPEFQTWLGELQPGDKAPDDLPGQVATILQYANVLVPPGYSDQYVGKWQKALVSSSEYFQKHRYTSLNNLLHPFHIAEMRRYLRALLSAGELSAGKGGYLHCRLKHNDPVFRFFHYQLTSIIGTIVGEPVQPSYVYVIRYEPGAELSRHTDREQCVFTLSICVDFQPEPRSLTRWPICIETDQGTVAIQQALGDGILFAGRELPHYRTRLPNRLTSTSALFHFVPRHFVGKLD